MANGYEEKNEGSIRDFLADVGDISTKVKERKGSSYISDGLEIQLLTKRMDDIRNASDDTLRTLTRRIDSLRTKQDVRRKEPRLMELGSGIVSFGSRRVSTVPSSDLMMLLRHLRSILLSEPGFFKSNELLLLVDYDCYGSATYRTTEVRRGNRFENSTTAISVRVSKNATEQDVTALVEVLDGIIDLGGKSVRSVDMPLPKSPDPVGGIKHYDDIAFLDPYEGTIRIHAFHPLLAGLLRMGSLKVLDFDDADGIEPTLAGYIGDMMNGESVYSVETRGGETIYLRIPKRF